MESKNMLSSYVFEHNPVGCSTNGVKNVMIGYYKISLYLHLYQFLKSLIKAQVLSSETILSSRGSKISSLNFFIDLEGCL